MPAMEIINVMMDQKPAGANAATPGRIFAGSLRSASPNDFQGMMQMTMTEYQAQSSKEGNLASGSDDNEMGKNFLINSNNPAQANMNLKKGEENDSPDETTTNPADENSTDELQETIAIPAFVNAVLVKNMIAELKAAGAEEASLTKKNHPLIEAKVNRITGMKDQLAITLEEKGIPADVVAGILKELDQAITAKVHGEQQNKAEKPPAHSDQTSPSFRQAAVNVLEKNGFSAEEVKGILKTVQQGMAELKQNAQNPSDQQISINQTLYHKEIIKEAAFSRKKIHDDIYQKEASLEDFKHENIEAKIKSNLLEKQMVKDGRKEEIGGQSENTKRSEKKDVFSDALKATANKQTILSDKDVNTQQLGKVITAIDQDDSGKFQKLAGDLSAKTSHASHEDTILPADMEQGSVNSEIQSLSTKGADFQPGKATVDTSKSIYQSVFDQIQESFSLVQSKDNGQVRLTLKPEIMGHLDMQIVVRNETVQIMMTVENEKVHQAMNAHIDDLKTALQNQGLKIDKIEVTLQNQPDPERTFYQDQANSRFNNPGQNTRHERMLNQGQALGDGHYPGSVPEVIQKQNSMEGVSIFA